MPYTVPMTASLPSYCTLYQDSSCTVPFSGIAANTDSTYVSMFCTANGTKTPSIVITDSCGNSASGSATVYGVNQIYSEDSVMVAAGGTGQGTSFSFPGGAGIYYGAQQIDLSANDPSVTFGTSSDTTCSSPITSVSGTDMTGGTVTVCGSTVGSYTATFSDHAGLLTSSSTSVDVY